MAHLTSEGEEGTKSLVRIGQGYDHKAPGHRGLWPISKGFWKDLFEQAVVRTSSKQTKSQHQSKQTLSSKCSL